MAENDAPEKVVTIVQHCADPYNGCCLPYKTPVTPNGWCVCNCGDCRVAKYQTQEKRNREWTATPNA